MLSGFTMDFALSNLSDVVAKLNLVFLRASHSWIVIQVNNGIKNRPFFDQIVTFDFENYSFCSGATLTLL